MSRVSATSGRRPPRIKIQRLRRPAVSPARLSALNKSSTRRHRRRTPSAVRVQVRSRRSRATAARLPLGIDVIRVVLLLAGAVLAVLVVLPALLEYAAAPFH